MDESEKENLNMTYNAVIESIIAEKKANPKYNNLFKNSEARVNLGLQMNPDYYFWLNLIIEKGNVKLIKGRLEDNYDLVLMSTLEGLMFFSTGENSTVHMMTKKNQFGEKKLRFEKGTTGRNIRKLLKISKLLVLD